MTATIAETLKSAVQRLGSRSESPRLDAELLMGKVTGLSRAALIMHGDESVSRDMAQSFADLVARRLTGMPVAYLTGSSEFWSLPLTVTPAVLIPRPETETLVEQVLQLKARDEHCAVLDLGTGSGAIALSLSVERPHWNITGIDVSEDALKIAAMNSQALGLTRIQWRLGSWFDCVVGARFDLIVANPPYIAASDPALDKLAAEPALALIAGPSGLEALSTIIAQAPAHLRAGGWLLLEHGSTQAQDVAALLEQRGFEAIRTVQDFAGRPRITLGSVHTHH
ncbi:MAG TPA: peptide chain release factor N(5)-glutamine methyltransferase [Steroidobacteraceae bacterium]|jgi:release factor glutamine methyltransferase